MTITILEKMIEHNNWANQQIIQACLALSDEQLNAKPQSATSGTIRQTLLHFVGSQSGYLNVLTLPLEERRQTAGLTLDGIQESARLSGEGLLALAHSWAGCPPTGRIQTRDGYYVEPWVNMVEVINHAAEHREQIKSMLSALGVTPPNIDGWSYGKAVKAVIPTSS